MFGNPAFWQTVTSLLAPLVGVLSIAISGGGGSRLSKRIAHHADLRQKLTDGTGAADRMDDFLSAEVTWLAEHEERRFKRKINWGNLVGAIVFAVLTSVGIFLLWNWVRGTYADGSWWVYVAGFTLTVFGLLFACLTGALFLSMFEPEKTEDQKATERAQKGAKKAARDAAKKS